MLKSRFAVILALLALLLAALTPAAVAQEETFGLGAEDYELLTSAIGQSSEFDSLGFDFTVTLTATGEEPVNVNLAGTGLIGENEAGPVLQITLGGTAETEGESQPVTFELIVIDNVAYVNDGSGWQGQKLEDILEDFGSMSPVPLDSIMGGGDMAENPEAMEGMMEAMNALGEINPADYVSMSRSGDEMVGDANTAHFTINVDAGKFLSSDAFTALMGAGMAMSGDENMAQQAEGMGQMLAMMFQDMNVALDYFVGTDDNMVRRFMFDFSMGVNPAMMGASSDAQPVDVQLTIDATNIAYNVDVSSITVPEGATMTESAG